MPINRKKIKSAAEKILRLRNGIAQHDNEELFKILSSIYPLELKSFPSNLAYNGWVVPKHWEVLEATISEQGEIIFDGTQHPLAVGGGSVSVNCQISKSELLSHINTLQKRPSNYVYNPLNNLRPWQKKWSLSVPFEQLRKFGSGPFDVKIVTKFHDHEMLVGSCFHQGSSDQTIIFNAHTCHPGQLNDGFSGVLAILKIFDELKSRKTKYSYLGVIAPEHLGTVFYLSDKSDDWLKKQKMAFIIESIASRGDLKLQDSFDRDSIASRLAYNSILTVQGYCERKPFRTIVGNDETVWEAGGIGIPAPSITRHPFPEYHTDADNLDHFSFVHFEQTLDVVRNLIDALELDVFVKRKFKGLIALSNPKIDSYKEQPNPTIDKGLSNRELNWGIFQDYMFSLLEGDQTILSLSEASNIPFPELYEYFLGLEAKSLVEFSKVCDLERYDNINIHSIPTQT